MRGRITDPPYISNCMATGEEYPGRYRPRLEEIEELMYLLEDERRDVEDLECLSVDLKEDVLDYYDVEIRACEREIAYHENGFCR